MTYFSIFSQTFFLPNWLIQIFIFLFGISIGSFVNVCIYRMPREESIIKPRSRCLNCGKTLSVLDLIPFFGYFFLLGKCRYCGIKISIKYPLIELLTAVIFLVLFYYFGLTLRFFSLIFFCSILIAVFFIDLEFYIIPDELTFSGTVLGLLFSFFTIGIKDSFIGALVGFSIIFAILVLSPLIFKQEGMGGGDVKFAGCMGAFLGLKGVVTALFLSFFIGAVVGILLLTTKIKKRKDYIPFGPSLVAASFITLVWGSKLIEIYLNLVLRKYA